jgi:hypothetical protein
MKAKAIKKIQLGKTKQKAEKRIFISAFNLILFFILEISGICFYPSFAEELKTVQMLILIF